MYCFPVETSAKSTAGNVDNYIISKPEQNARYYPDILFGIFVSPNEIFDEVDHGRLFLGVGFGDEERDGGERVIIDNTSVAAVEETVKI